MNELWDVWWNEVKFKVFGGSDQEKEVVLCACEYGNVFGIMCSAIFRSAVR